MYTMISRRYLFLTESEFAIRINLTVLYGSSINFYLSIATLSKIRHYHACIIIKIQYYMDCLRHV